METYLLNSICEFTGPPKRENIENISNTHAPVPGSQQLHCELSAIAESFSLPACNVLAQAHDLLQSNAYFVAAKGPRYKPH